MIVRQTGNGNYLVTIAIGVSYFESWNNVSLPSWIRYAEKYDLGIIVITADLLERHNQFWKKPTWQKMLIPKYIFEQKVECNFVCYIDSDVIINPFAPNIFDLAIHNKIGVVSVRHNMPFDFYEVNRRLAYLRRTYIEFDFSLTSAQHFSTKELYDYHGFPDQKDEFCAGVLLFSPKYFAEILESWFYLYRADVKSITNGGEQTHLNYHVLSSKVANFLPYKFQTIWSFEIAWSHFRLFEERFENEESLSEVLNQVLLNSYFLHFAGNQAETMSAFVKGVIDIDSFIEKWNDLDKYNYLKFIPKALS